MKLTKKLWLVALAAILITLFTVLGASAETLSGDCSADGSSVSWTLDTESGALVISGTGSMANCTKGTAPWYDNRASIKSVTIEENVTGVGEYAFYNLSSMTSLSLPSSLTTIGKYAFSNCKSLTEVTIPASVSTLNDNIFGTCSKLATVNLNEGLGIISARAFQSCTSLESIVIPASVSRTGTSGLASGDGVFKGCTGLKSISYLGKNTNIYGNFPSQDIVLYGYEGSKAQAFANNDTTDNVTFDHISFGGSCGESTTWRFYTKDGSLVISGIGAMNGYENTTMPWYDYRKQVTSIVIEEGVTSIGKRAFSECTATTVTIADSVTVINGYAFRICKNITEVNLGSGLVAINEYAFNELSSLESIVIPGNVKKINNYVFNNCTKLKSITLSEGIESISQRAFNNCTALTEIVFPSTLKTLGSAGNDYPALNNCTGLVKVTFLSPDTQIYPDASKSIPDTATICCYEGSAAEAYADKYGKAKETFSKPFAYRLTTVFELDAKAVNAPVGEYLPIVTLERQSIDAKAALNLLYVNENGALYAFTAEGDKLALLNSAGEAAVLGDGDKISIVYNDQNGEARFYVNNALLLYSDELKPATSLKVASDELLAIKTISEKLAMPDGFECDALFNTEDTPASFVGFQTNEDKSAIRILSGINMLYYNSVGFEIELYADDVLKGSVTKMANTVFSSILDGDEKVTAEELDCGYIAIATISDVNRADYGESENVYFIIKPFSTIGGEKLYGREKRITVTFDESGEGNEFVNGIVAPFVPVVRFVATSDIHFTDSVGTNASKFKKIMDQLSSFVLDDSKNDGYAGLDAVLMAGDIANNGTATQIEIAKNFFDENLPEDIELVITMGNHDWNAWETIGADQSLAQFEAAFGDATKSTVIGGYHFITICCDSVPPAQTWRGYGWDYSAETIAKAEELIEAAIADTGADKPVFIIQHVPMVGTVAGSDSMCPCDSLKPLQDKYSNLVIFAGHSHHPINDECSIYQENNTVVGTGTLQVSQVHLVEVDEFGRVRFRKYSGTEQDFIGETWFVDSFDPRDFVYTADRFSAEDLFFADGAEITLTAVGSESVSASFLPVPAESLSARAYKLVVTNTAGEAVATQFVEHTYYAENYTTPISATVTSLTPGTAYTLSVYALNSLYITDYESEDTLASAPITISFTTAKDTSSTGGDLINLSINATAQSAANLASSGVDATMKGTPTFSYDETIGMDVVTFNGTDKQAISHNFYSVYEQLVDGFSVEAYFKINEAPTEKDVVAFGAMQSCWFGLNINKSGTMTFNIHDGSGYLKLSTTDKYEVNKYYHVVATYDTNHAKLYVDGELVATIEMTNLKVHSKSSCYKVLVGADFDLDNGMSSMSKTTFAAFNLHSEAMTADEVTTAYNGFKH